MTKITGIGFEPIITSLKIRSHTIRPTCKMRKGEKQCGKTQKKEKGAPKCADRYPPRNEGVRSRRCSASKVQNPLREKQRRSERKSAERDRPRERALRARGGPQRPPRVEVR